MIRKLPIIIFAITLLFTAGCSTPRNGDDLTTLHLDDLLVAFQVHHWVLELPEDADENDLFLLVSEHSDGTTHSWAEYSGKPGDKLKLIIWKSPHDDDFSYLLKHPSANAVGQVKYPFSFLARRAADSGETMKVGEFFMKGSKEGRVSTGVNELDATEHGMRMTVVRDYFDNWD